MTGINLRTAVTEINRRGILLIFPIKNAKEPQSLWSALFPRKKMRWEWSSEGDFSVAELWHLRTKLAVSGKVVYGKWYQGRATVFSRRMFAALLSRTSTMEDPLRGLSPESLRILEALEDDSPMATRRLREAVDLQGKGGEGAFNRAMRALWARLLIIGAGEEDEGGFPSLSVGATRLLEEELWDSSKEITVADREQVVSEYLSPDSLFVRNFRKIEKGLF